MIKEEDDGVKKVMRKTTTYGNVMSHEIKGRKKGESRYEPPLPTSLIKEEKVNGIYGDLPTTDNYGESIGMKKSDKHKVQYEPPLPTSLIKEEAYIPPQMRKSTRSPNSCYGELKYECKNQTYEPPLPNSLLEIKSEKSKHSTQKPVALMEWILKYYSKEGDTVLDPTMGSGSTGVSCKNMNRNFIGIEMDDEIYETACERVWGDE